MVQTLTFGVIPDFDMLAKMARSLSAEMCPSRFRTSRPIRAAGSTRSNSRPAGNMRMFHLLGPGPRTAALRTIIAADYPRSNARSVSDLWRSIRMPSETT
jgi:hypothetical protein